MNTNVGDVIQIVVITGHITYAVVEAASGTQVKFDITYLSRLVAHEADSDMPDGVLQVKAEMSASDTRLVFSVN